MHHPAMLPRMDGYTRSVLVVEADATERERPAAASRATASRSCCARVRLSPTTRIGARSGTCPLATEEAIVVLDMSLDSETVMVDARRGPARDVPGLRPPGGRPGFTPKRGGAGTTAWSPSTIEKADLVRRNRPTAKGSTLRHGTTMKRNTMRGSRARRRDWSTVEGCAHPFYSALILIGVIDVQIRT